MLQCPAGRLTHLQSTCLVGMHTVVDQSDTGVINLYRSLSKSLAITAVNATGLKSLGADAPGDLGIGLIGDLFHDNGNCPCSMQLLKRSHRGSPGECTANFRTLPGILSGPVLFVMFIRFGAVLTSAVSIAMFSAIVKAKKATQISYIDVSTK